jgi:hypothetical protein
MNALPTPVANKLASLIPLLSSDKSGEVMATAQAIGRTLKSADLDFHDLARVIKAPPPVVQREQRKSYLWQVIATACLKHTQAYRLNPREVEFLSSMARWPTSPSEKQMGWLETIADTLGVNARAAA